MANVDVLFLCLGATLFHDRATIEHGTEAGRRARLKKTITNGHESTPIIFVRSCSFLLLPLVSIRVNSWLQFLPVLALVSCATTTTHQFAQPTAAWQTRPGQLMYRNATTTVIGDVIVRNSKAGDFELTFSKGPGVNLLVLRQDANFAEIEGPMAGRGWSGATASAPQQLRGWVELRDAIVRSKDRHQVRHVSGSETFVFRF